MRAESFEKQSNKSEQSGSDQMISKPASNLDSPDLKSILPSR
jgi:hypothetical protein